MHGQLAKYFHFNNTDPLSSTSTDPVMVCFCNTSSHLPQCSEKTHQTSTYQEMEVNTTIATYTKILMVVPVLVLCWLIQRMLHWFVTMEDK